MDRKTRESEQESLHALSNTTLGAFQRHLAHARKSVLSLGVLASVWGATAHASADVHVSFTTMEINDCGEMFACDWRLSCWLGSQENETQFFSMVEADTGDNIPINSALVTQQGFPVTVNCTVHEHDGGIGAVWEDIGSDQVTVTDVGSYMLHMENHEGDVDILFVVDEIGSSSGPITSEEPPPPPPPCLNDGGDTDQDGLCDHFDYDDDNDGCSDRVDDHPKNRYVAAGPSVALMCSPSHGQWTADTAIDSDGDGYRDCRDDDDDGDGIADLNDACRLMAGEDLLSCLQVRPPCAGASLPGLACLNGGCNQLFVRFEWLINPDPTLNVRFAVVSLEKDRLTLAPEKMSSRDGLRLLQQGRGQSEQFRLTLVDQKGKQVGVLGSYLTGSERLRTTTVLSGEHVIVDLAGLESRTAGLR